MGFNVDDLKQSNFITQKDVDPPVLVTITGSKKVNVAQEGAEPKYEWTLLFKELDKPLIVKPTNGQLIEVIIGSKNSDDWLGHKIVLYIEPSVSYGGKITGGIRARAPSKAYMTAQNTSAEDKAAQEVVDSVDGSNVENDPRNPGDNIPF